MKLFRIGVLLASTTALTMGCQTGGPINFLSQQTSPKLPDEIVSSGESEIRQVANTEPAPAIVTIESEDQLQQIIGNTDNIVLVDFYADWCGPCRQQSKILHDLEDEAAQRDASIVKVNIDHYPRLAQQFQVSSLPTLLVFKNGDVVDRRIGMADHQQISQMLTR